MLRFRLFFTVVLVLAAGCASPQRVAHDSEPPREHPQQSAENGELKLVQFEAAAPDQSDATDAQELSASVDGEPLNASSPPSTLESLEQIALDENPQLAKLYQEYEAAAARASYVDKLPDPRIGANVFVNPLQTMSGSQRANLSFMQMIPWLGKLDAEAQRAHFEALAVRAEYQSARLEVISKIRVGWYRLYVIDKQIATTLANQQLLESLIEIANARIATGGASQGDVLLGTLELSELQERLLALRRQRIAVASAINRLTGRDPETSIAGPKEIVVATPDWTVAELAYLAGESQPEIQASDLRTQATRWGIEVARLTRRPELTLTANYFVTDDNRPASTVVNVGEDPWSLGAQITVPLWRDKYDAMEDEAMWKHYAAHSAEEDLRLRYEALLLDLLAEVRRAAETAELYQSTILPQSRQTLAADQEAYANGTVEFDRVIRDYRSLLTLELGYYQALGDLAIAVAQIRRAVGFDVPLDGDSHVESDQAD